MSILVGYQEMGFVYDSGLIQKTISEEL